MRDLAGIRQKNDEAVRREFEEAMTDRNFALARRIQLANPDLNLASNIPWWEVGDNAR